MKRFIQHSPPHPGEILHELYFEPLGLTVTDAAKKLFIARPNLSQLINGKMGISPLTAVKLSRAFKTSPQYWLNMQIKFDLWEVMKSEKDKISEVQILI